MKLFRKIQDRTFHLFKTTCPFTIFQWYKNIRVSHDFSGIKDKCPCTKLEEVTEKGGCWYRSQGGWFLLLPGIVFKMCLYKGFPAKEKKSLFGFQLLAFLSQPGQSRIVSGHYIEYTNTNASWREKGVCAFFYICHYRWEKNGGGVALDNKGWKSL